MRTFYCLLTLLLLGSPALAREIFVNNIAGDDRFAGRQATRPRRPRRTRPDPGQGPATGRPRRHDRPGQDRRPLSREHQPGRAADTAARRNEPFTIHGNGAILDGSTASCRSMGKLQGRHLPSPRASDEQPAAVPRRPARRRECLPPKTPKTPPELQPRQWCSVEGRIYFCVEKSKLPGDYKLSYAHEQTGITLFHVEHVRIADLTVQGFQVDGINLSNSAREVLLSNVTCRGNGRNGVAVGGASSVTIRASLLGDNGQAQLLTSALFRDASVQHPSALEHRARLGRSRRPRLHRREASVKAGKTNSARRHAGAEAMRRDTVVGRPMEILLIEDDLEDAGMTIEALREGDVPCRISLVRDGEEAMEFLLRQDKYRRAPQPDMILLDLNLPKKSGREVLAEVKADQRLADVPVVVLTSSDALTSRSCRPKTCTSKAISSSRSTSSTSTAWSSRFGSTCFPT